MKIEDNFLEQKDFDELQNFMMNDDLNWHYIDYIDYEKDQETTFQFTHMFYYVGRSDGFFENLGPIFNIIKPISIWRIKANLLTRTPTIVENAFHIDMTLISEEKLEQLTTAIFYVNTNNGHTEFEDGTKVESKANRMVTFPANLKHRGTSCTNEKTRVVINFNYFK